MLVADLHCDTISELFKAEDECSLAQNQLHIDLEKMRAGDYLLQNFAMYINLEEAEAPLQSCLELIDCFYTQLELNQDKLGLVLSFDDIKKNQQAGKLSALLTIEEGGVTECSLAQLRNFYRLGVRMLTLTWNYENGIGFPNVRLIKGGIPDFKTPDTTNGLTDFGLEFICEMERLGMIIDVSHLSDAGFYQVLSHTKKPFVASHSNARAVCPHVRNLTDDMIRKLADRGGVLGINFCPAFLEEDDAETSGSLAAIVSHIKHIVSVGGYECIGLGSDFDGIPTNKAMPSASSLPLLAEALQKSGMKPHEIEAIFYRNVLRVYKELLV